MPTQTKIYRHASIYYESKKVADFKGFEFTISSGNEDMVGDEGWSGRSSGAKMSKLSADAIVPIAGIQISVVRDLLNDEYVDIGLGVIDGTIYKVKMGVDQASFTSDATAGTLTGKFEFSGGEPEIVG